MAVRAPRARFRLDTPAKWTLAGIGFTVVMGTLWHFVFDWAGKWTPLALVFPVNESTWEHLKIAFWPMLAWALIERGTLQKQVSNFLTATVAGATVAITAIVVLFYTYTGIIGHDVFWLDILTFVVAVVAGFWVRLRLMRAPQMQNETGAKVVLAVLLVAFLTLTYFPPRAELWRDPVTGGFGLPST